MAAVDQFAIERLYYDYADGIDGPNGPLTEQILALFTPDGHWEMVGTATYDGVEQLRGHFSESRWTHPTHHFITNIRVDVDADGLGASTTAYTFFFGRRRPRGEQLEGPRVSNALRYDNHCVIVDGRWFFDSMRVSFHYGEQS